MMAAPALAFFALLCGILTPLGWVFFIALACVPMGAGLVRLGMWRDA